MSNRRELDLVLMGATGFTGRLVATHLARHAPGTHRIGIAGRSSFSSPETSNAGSVPLAEGGTMPSNRDVTAGSIDVARPRAPMAMCGV